MNNAESARNVEMLWAYHRSKHTNSKESTQLRSSLIQNNNGLVVTIATRLKDRCGEDLDELVQWGVVGLDKAIQRFDPSRKVAFSSFAVPYIKGEILHFLRDNWRGSYKIPRRWIEFHGTVNKIHREFAAAGRSQSIDDIAVSLLLEKPGCLNEQEARRNWATIKQAMHRKPVVSLEENTHQIAVETDEGDDRIKVLRQHLSKLSEPHYSCLVSRFFDGLSDEAIARQQGLSLEKIQELIQDGIDWLKFQIEAATGAP
jgi:RNA polymerase sigma-B factor